MGHIPDDLLYSGLLKGQEHQSDVGHFWIQIRKYGQENGLASLTIVTPQVQSCPFFLHLCLLIYLLFSEATSLRKPQELGTWNAMKPHSELDCNLEDPGQINFARTEYGLK